MSSRVKDINLVIQHSYKVNYAVYVRL